jgi:hypothetical protein
MPPEAETTPSIANARTTRIERDVTMASHGITLPAAKLRWQCIVNASEIRSQTRAIEQEN